MKKIIQNTEENVKHLTIPCEKSIMPIDMFRHPDIFFLLTSPIEVIPKKFGEHLIPLCNRLGFDGAALYSNVGDAKKLYFFAGVYKGNPVKELPRELPHISADQIKTPTFEDIQNKVLQLDQEQLPESVKRFLEKYGINRIYVSSFITHTKIHFIFIGASESKRSLNNEEVEDLMKYIRLLSILFDMCHISRSYNTLKNCLREEVIIQDLNHRIIEVNKSAALSIGIEDPDDLAGKICYKLWANRDSPCPSCPIKITTKTLKSEESEVMMPDGRWYLVKSSPILSEAGELTGFVILRMDITEKKKVEKEAKRFNKIVKKLFDQQLVGVVISDYEKNILDVNEARAKMLGYTREELLKMKWNDFTHPDDVHMLSEMLCALKNKKIQNFTIDVRCVRKDGKIAWQRVFASPLEIDGEKLVITTVMDITEDIVTKEKLQELLTERNLILNIIPQKIYKVTQNGNASPIPSTSGKSEKLANLIGKNPEETEELIKGVLSSEKPSKVIHIKKQKTGAKYFSTTLLKLDNNTILAVENDITDLKIQQIETLKQRNRLIRLTEGIIKALSHIIDLKEPYTAGHQSRVAEIAYLVGKEMGLDKNTLTTLRYAGLLHDIGKIVLPMEILNKPGKLTELEFSLIRQHPTFSYEILKDIEFEGPVAEIAYQHHERLDGSGYPRGLKDDEILLEARIIACADVYEAMTSHRPYRPALPPEEAIKELKEKAGILYDPEVVKIMEKLYLEGKLPKSGSEKVST